MRGRTEWELTWRLEGPMTVLVVFVGHSEGARRAGRECGGAGAQAWANGGGGGDEKAVVMGDIGSSRS
jgi:hypothetical protein